MSSAAASSRPRGSRRPVVPNPSPSRHVLSTELVEITIPPQLPSTGPAPSAQPRAPREPRHRHRTAHRHGPTPTEQDTRAEPRGATRRRPEPVARSDRQQLSARSDRSDSTQSSQVEEAARARQRGQLRGGVRGRGRSASQQSEEEEKRFEVDPPRMEDETDVDGGHVTSDDDNASSQPTQTLEDADPFAHKGGVPFELPNLREMDGEIDEDEAEDIEVENEVKNKEIELSTVRDNLRRENTNKSLLEMKKTIYDERAPVVLVEEVDETETSCDMTICHRAYQCCCSPYVDIWVPCPTKRTLRKTLNRLDFNSFNPYELFFDYYRPFWTSVGALITMGCMTVMMFTAIFVFTSLQDDVRIQQTTMTGLSEKQYELSNLTGIVLMDRFGSPVLDASLVNYYFESCLDHAPLLVTGPVCTPVAMSLCSIGDLTAAVCPSQRVYAQGIFTDKTYSYVRFSINMCQNRTSTVPCRDASVLADVIDGASVHMRWTMSVPDLDTTLIKSPVYTDARSWRVRPSLQDEAHAFYEQVSNQFPSRILRATRYIEYTRLDRIETHTKAFVNATNSTNVIFALENKLLPEVRVVVYVGQTFLDSLAAIGGVFVMVTIFITLFSIAFTQNWFMQAGALEVVEEVPQKLIRMKERELQDIKDRMLEMGAHKVMGVTADELIDYLNTKRDQELAAYRHCLAATFNPVKKAATDNRSATEKHDETVRKANSVGPMSADDMAAAQERKARAEFMKRNDQLQDLLRVDDTKRFEDPELVKNLNLLHIEELKRQIAHLERFVKKLTFELDVQQ